MKLVTSIAAGVAAAALTAAVPALAVQSNGKAGSATPAAARAQAKCTAAQLRQHATNCTRGAQANVHAQTHNMAHH